MALLLWIASHPDCRPDTWNGALAVPEPLTFMFCQPGQPENNVPGSGNDSIAMPPALQSEDAWNYELE